MNTVYDIIIFWGIVSLILLVLGPICVAITNRMAANRLGIKSIKEYKEYEKELDSNFAQLTK